MVENFDAYGQVDSARRNVADSKKTSAVLNKIGQYIFWTLVLVIVSARVFYFSANPAFDVHDVQTSRSTVTR